MSQLFDVLRVADNGLVVLDGSLHNDDGYMTVIEGSGHSRDKLMSFFVSELDESRGVSTRNGFPVVRIEHGSYGWTPRIKHCEPYTDGWGCDQAGDWHRHLVEVAGGDELTLLSLSHRAMVAEPMTYDEWWKATHPQSHDSESGESA